VSADRGETATTARKADRPSVGEARGWVGSRLDEISGAPVGRIEGIYVDGRSGEPEWLVVRRGRFGSRCFVPAREAVDAVGHVWVPWDRATIRRAPDAERGAPLTVGEEHELCAHYGIAEGVGRAADLAGRPRSDASSRPG
jgi:hypothetical protein